MTKNSHNVASLLILLKGGNRQAFKKVYKIYYGTILAFVLKLTNNRIEAEDIVQETFVKLWLFRERIDLDNSIKSFLFKASYNMYIDQHRKKMRTKEILRELYFQKLVSLSEEQDDMKEKKMTLLQNEINRLPQKCRHIFMMSKFEGLTYNEISEELNISVKTVENQISIALFKLRSCLKKKRQQF